MPRPVVPPYMTNSAGGSSGMLGVVRLFHFRDHILGSMQCIGILLQLYGHPLDDAVPLSHAGQERSCHVSSPGLKIRQTGPDISHFTVRTLSPPLRPPHKSAQGRLGRLEKFEACLQGLL